MATYSFEDGTADGWSSFNRATTPVATNAAAYAGSYSLLTTTGSGGAGGPSIALSGVLLAGAQYTITGYVMLTSGEAATNANFTIKRTLGWTASRWCVSIIRCRSITACRRSRRNWGVVDETKLPGYGMKFSASMSAGTRDTRTVTITATNGVVGPAYATQITGFSLKQDSGPRCTPTVTAPGAFPIVLGDIAPGASASATFTIRLVGCNPNAEFVLKAPWSSATYDTGTFVMETNFRRDN